MILRYIQKEIAVNAVKYDGTNENELREFAGSRRITKNPGGDLFFDQPFHGGMYRRLCKNDYLVNFGNPDISFAVHPWIFESMFMPVSEERIELVHLKKFAESLDKSLHEEFDLVCSVICQYDECEDNMFDHEVLGDVAARLFSIREETDFLIADINDSLKHLDECEKTPENQDNPKNKTSVSPFGRLEEEDFYDSRGGIR